MTKIIFVCTGNAFRSMTAEKCAKDYLKKNKITNIRIDSAATMPYPQEPQPAVLERLKHHGITVRHKYKKLTKKLITEYQEEKI